MTMQHEYTVRERLARIDLDATATRPPGRRQPWTIEAGYWRSEGSTEKAAVDTLTAGLRTWLAMYRRPQVLTFGGYVAVVSVDLQYDGNLTWLREVVSPDGRISHSSGSAVDWTEAEASARYTLAHHWVDWFDDDSVHAAAAYLKGIKGQYGPDELLRYAAWQRAAKAAMDAGRDDWHEWTGAHASEFAVPPAEASMPTPTIDREAHEQAQQRTRGSEFAKVCSYRSNLTP